MDEADVFVHTATSHFSVKSIYGFPSGTDRRFEKTWHPWAIVEQLGCKYLNARLEVLQNFPCRLPRTLAFG
jgi:hypothetical protein